MKAPVISVVLPVYNGAMYLEAAIRSILTQTFTDFELIVVNDGSSDRSLEIIQSFSDPRLICINNETNIKLIKSLNKAVSAARGTYIARMDADDIACPDRLARQLQEFYLDDSLDIVNANPWLLDSSGKNIRKQIGEFVISGHAMSLLIPLQNLICHPSVMVKASSLKKFLYRDAPECEHVEDFDLWNRLFAAGANCRTIKKSVLLYRLNAGSINHMQRKDQVIRIASLSKDYLMMRFNFLFLEGVLAKLVDEGSACSAEEFIRIFSEIDRYFAHILAIDARSVSAKRELLFWKSRRMQTFIFRSIGKVSARDVFSSLVYYGTRIRWVDIVVSFEILKRRLSPERQVSNALTS